MISTYNLSIGRRLYIVALRDVQHLLYPFLGQGSLID